MNEFDQLSYNLGLLPSPAWINQYFDIVKRLLADLGIDNEDPRLSLNIDTNGNLPMILGQRYVIQPRPGERVRCIVPSDYDSNAYHVIIGQFSRNSTRDAKWVEFDFPLDKPFPPALYKACVSACKNILKRTTRSGFRKYHDDLMYDFIIDPFARKEILDDLINFPVKKAPLVKAKPEDTQLRTYLLTWNPKKFAWVDLQDRIAELQQYGKTVMSWSCGTGKRIKPGDRVFLMLLGTVPVKGLIGSGYVTSYPFTDAHFGVDGKDARYVQVEFDVLLDPEYDPPLTLEELQSGKLAEQLWTPQNSGISIQQELRPELEKRWFRHLQNNQFEYPPFEQAQDASPEDLMEGGSYQVLQNRYERNMEARRRCLDHHGYSCSVCSFNFETTYGHLGERFIHVHHHQQVAHQDGPYKIDPIKDLSPVCPNCHAMLHRSKEPMRIEALAALLKNSKASKKRKP